MSHDCCVALPCGAMGLSAYFVIILTMGEGGLKCILLVPNLCPRFCSCWSIRNVQLAWSDHDLLCISASPVVGMSFLTHNGQIRLYVRWPFWLTKQHKWFILEVEIHYISRWNKYYLLNHAKESNYPLFLRKNIYSWLSINLDCSVAHRVCVFGPLRG